MKKIIFIFFFSACFVGIQAQTPWYTNGNGSTTSSDFIGTTASQPLIFKTNGIERMQLLPNKSFLGIGVSNPLATLHLHFQQIFGDPSSPKLLQLTTYATGNGINNGFCIFSDEITRDIKFKQQEQAKFFIEGVGGGFVVAPTGNIGFGTDAPEEKVHLQGTLLIDRTASTPSSLQFRHPDNIRGIPPPDDDPQIYIAPHYWDIYSDINGLKFNKVLKSNGTSAQMMALTWDGRMGIGVASPWAKLHVGQHILADGNITTKDKLILATDNTTENRWEISRTSIGLNYAYNTTSLKDILFLGNDGKIGIGKTNPAAELDVNGTATVTELNAQRATVNTSFTAGSATINNTLTAKDLKTTGLLCAKEIRVMRSGAPCWPDYVFSKDYNLMPLRELEQFVNENHHLPNVPTATSVAENGIDLGEMNATLLKKVEELTLYIIDLQKQIDELKKQ